MAPKRSSGRETSDTRSRPAHSGRSESGQPATASRSASFCGGAPSTTQSRSSRKDPAMLLNAVTSTTMLPQGGSVPRGTSTSKAQPKPRESTSASSAACRRLATWARPAAEVNVFAASFDESKSIFGRAAGASRPRRVDCFVFVDATDSCARFAARNLRASNRKLAVMADMFRTKSRSVFRSNKGTAPKSRRGSGGAAGTMTLSGSCGASAGAKGPGASAPASKIS
mmetsp:Transcript_12193/g.40677  ORF Transcript_12193/g.40677 Transcript_12193/m.40677 type:complete len:226 (+) Transcript_12193:1699-2376(+)